MIPKTGSGSFGTFLGVFVPTFLSIIGVILFLRLGYIVGVAGTLGAIIIILLAVSVTLSTGLALSSITTNIRIGAGGAYSIISKTLGLEVGGSVGIPLYLAQIFSIVLYVLGFSEAWKFVFPEHNQLAVAVVTFILLFLLTFISTKIAVKAQLVVFIVVLLSLLSVFLGGGVFEPTKDVPLIGEFVQLPFWALFALFFPAVTGLMAGIGLSGELSDPKRQIPKGVIGALMITTIIYVAIVAWFGFSTNSAALISDNLLIVNLSAIPDLVILGILLASFSSALTTLVAAPRVLQALSSNHIIPYANVLTEKTDAGEPRNAIFFTSGLVFVLLLIGNLNSVAQILTIFFLITYAMINLAVFLEQSLGLASFRPIFRIPKFVTLYGVISSIIFMFLINPLAGFAAVILIFFIYLYLVNRRLAPGEGDIRSGLLREISEWTAKKVMSLPEATKHVWKPNILVPVISTKTLFGNFPLIKALGFPHGTMTVLGFNLMRASENPERPMTKKEMEAELADLPYLVDKFGEQGIFTSFSTVDVYDYSKGLVVSLEAIESQVFPPNILLLPFKPNKLPQSSLQNTIESCNKMNVGCAIFSRNSEVSLGSEEDIHVWISPRAMDKDFYADRDFDLSLLMAYKLQRNWNGRIHLWMCVPLDQKRDAEYYLAKLVYEGRFPPSTTINIYNLDFIEALKRSPTGDIHIIPFRYTDINKMLEISRIDDRSFLFVMDSTKEDILS